MALATSRWLALVALAGLAIPVQAAIDHRGDLRNKQSLVSFPVQSQESTSSFQKRGQDLRLIGNSTSVVYYIQLYIGTPQQAVKVLIDTGSNELWVSPDCSTVTDIQLCKSYGIYVPSTSSTSKISTTDAFNVISYGDGSSVNLTYYTDTITLTTGIQVPGAKFGVATNSSGLDSGILGIGFGESSEDIRYQNFVDQLAALQITNSKAFSLAISNQTNTGVIIFGGVDTKKFSGKLVSNDILPSQGNEPFARYWLQMTDLGFTDSTGNSKNYSESNAVVVLDTGSTLSYLPFAVVEALALDLQATLDNATEQYMMPCSQLHNTSYVDFSFGDVAISVSLSDFTFQADENTCLMGVQPASGYLNVLGLNFLRSAYVVFDQTLNTISLAQYVNCGQNEQDMPTSGAAGFVGECTTRTSNSTGTTGTTPDPGSTTSPASSASAGAQSAGKSVSGLSPGASAGIGVGASLGSIAIAGLLYLIIRSRRNAASPKTETSALSCKTPDPDTPGMQENLYYNTGNLPPQEIGSNPPGYGYQYHPPMSEVAEEPQAVEMEAGDQRWSQYKNWQTQPVEMGYNVTAQQPLELPGEQQHAVVSPQSPNLTSVSPQTAHSGQ